MLICSLTWLDLVSVLNHGIEEAKILFYISAAVYMLVVEFEASA